MTKKHNNLLKSQHYFKLNKIEYQEFNDGFHWKVGDLDFWPSTHKWQDHKNNIYKMEGLEEFIKYYEAHKSTKLESGTHFCPHCNGIININIEKGK